MEQEIQSHLLRLSILIATSLSTLLEPTDPTIVSDTASVSPDASKKLVEQISNDLKSIITSVQTTSTNLTLALKPSDKTAQSTPSSSALISPIHGLDKASLEAANAQLVKITNDFVPKLVFLARKASSEATHYTYAPKTADDVQREREEREFVKSKGGHVVQHRFARENEKLVKIKHGGIGKSWSKVVVSAVFELLEAIGELCKAYMDQRTRAVMEKASSARRKADGATGPSQVNAIDSTPKTAKEARQAALHATAVVWSACDGVLKGKDALFSDNRTAVQLCWKGRTESLKDALQELKEALEESNENGDKDQHKDDDDDVDDLFDQLDNMSLSPDQKAVAERHLPLLKACCQLHSIVGKEYLSPTSTDSAVDLDDLNDAGDALSEEVDNLIAALLYGDLGDDDDEESATDDEDDEGDDEVQSALEGLLKATGTLFEAGVSEENVNKTIDDQRATIDSLAKELQGER